MGKLAFPFDPKLTTQDRIILNILQKEYELHGDAAAGPSSDADEDSDDSGIKHSKIITPSPEGTLLSRQCVLVKSQFFNRFIGNAQLTLVDIQDQEQQAIACFKKLNDPKSDNFEPTVFCMFDQANIKNPFLRQWIIDPYIRWARGVVRVETDVVMISHLLLYFCTSVPSAIYLYVNFHWWHALLHCVMQGWSMGPFTLLKHQHIHMRGVLNQKYNLIDRAFPYILDPLMGHTWNSYYYHHVKHHHVEGNGPNDLSSTIRYQRDSVWDFAQYVGRFYFLVWLDLPMYFVRTGKLNLALQAGAYEWGNYIFLYLMYSYVNARSTIFVFLIPLAFMRLALMTGNWGQHAFVDEVEPDSDFRSSITLIDSVVCIR